MFNYFSLRNPKSFPNFSINMIDVGHRIPKKEDAAIIVKFCNRKDRDSFYQQKKLFQKLDSSQVVYLMTVPKKEDAAIIVKFCNRKDRDSFYQQKKLFQKLDSSQVVSDNQSDENNYPKTEYKSRSWDTKLYINESLTPENKELFGKARKSGKEAGFKHIWTYKGGIRMKKDDDSQTFKIKSLEDLPQIDDALYSTNESAITI